MLVSMVCVTTVSALADTTSTKALKNAGASYIEISQKADLEFSFDAYFDALPSGKTSVNAQHTDGDFGSTWFSDAYDTNNVKGRLCVESTGAVTFHGTTLATITAGQWHNMGYRVSYGDETVSVTAFIDDSEVTVNYDASTFGWISKVYFDDKGVELYYDNVVVEYGSTSYNFDFEDGAIPSQIVQNGATVFEVVQFGQVQEPQAEEVALSGLPSSGLSKTEGGFTFNAVCPGINDAPGCSITNNDGKITVIANRTCSNDWARVKLDGDTSGYNYVYYEWTVEFKDIYPSLFNFYAGPANGSYYTSLNQSVVYGGADAGILRTDGTYITSGTDYVFGVLIDRVNGRYGIYQDYSLKMTGMSPESDGLKTLSSTDIGQMCLEYYGPTSDGIIFKNARVITSGSAITPSEPPAPELRGTLFEGTTIGSVQNGVTLSAASAGDGSAVNSAGTAVLTSTGESSGANWVRLNLEFPVNSSTHTGYVYREYTVTVPSVAPNQLYIGSHGFINRWNSVIYIQDKITTGTSQIIAHLYEISTGNFEIYVDGTLVSQGTVRGGGADGINEFIFEYRGGASNNPLTVTNAKLDYVVEKPVIEPVVKDIVLISSLPEAGATSKTENGATFEVRQTTSSSAYTIVNDGEKITATANQANAKVAYVFNYPVKSGVVYYEMEITMSAAPAKVDNAARPYANFGWSDMGWDSIEKSNTVPGHKYTLGIKYDGTTGGYYATVDGEIVEAGYTDPQAGIGEVYMLEPYAANVGDVYTLTNIRAEFYAEGDFTDFAGAYVSLHSSSGYNGNAVIIKGENSTLPENAVLYVAAYTEENELIAVRTSPITLSEGINGIKDKFSRENFDSLGTVHTLKAFIWDTKGNPLGLSSDIIA